MARRVRVGSRLRGPWGGGAADAAIAGDREAVAAAGEGDLPGGFSGDGRGRALHHPGRRAAEPLRQALREAEERRA